MHQKHVSERLIHQQSKVLIGENDMISVTEEQPSACDNFNSELEVKIKSSLKQKDYLEADMNMSQDFDNKSATENTYNFNEPSHAEFMAKHAGSFEILADDANTQRKFLENINFNDGNHLSEAELKHNAYNAFKTIEKLQTELM